MRISMYFRASLVLLVGGSLVGCAGQNFGSIASTVLGQAGYGSSTSSVDSLFAAGQGIIEATTPLSEEQEYYLGRAVSGSILGRYRPYKSEAVQRYVNVVGRTVSAFSDRPDTFRGYRFLVVDSNEINAMAAPSGFIFITKGLLRELKSEDELAAVLAHEVAHVVHRDGVNAISQAKLTKALTVVGREVVASQAPAELAMVTDVFSDSVDDVVETLVTSGYSRSQEYDADEYAQELLGRAGYDPSALARALTNLEGVSKEAQELGGWYSTHPSPKDRLEELEEVDGPRSSASVGMKIRTSRFQTGIGAVR